MMLVEGKGAVPPKPHKIMLTPGDCASFRRFIKAPAGDPLVFTVREIVAAA